jgi:hypothetical protein
MEFYLLNEYRETVTIIKTFESYLWTKKYQDVGGCVIVLTPNAELLNDLKQAKYIYREDDDMVCEIKKIHISVDNETGKYTLTITGIGIETILSQRIVWEMFNHTDTAESYCRELVRINFIDSTDDRKIDYIKLGVLKGFKEQITKQVTYDEVLSTIIEICKSYNLGFRLRTDEYKDFVLDFYRGEDKEYVVFSKDYNNLQSFEYEVDLSAYKNVCLVGGEGEGTARKTAAIGKASGIDRYETFADAKSQSSEEETISNYVGVLIESGVEHLATKAVTTKFACKIDVEQFEYKVDYNLGDIVTVEGEYGLTFKARIVEVVECEDSSPYRITVNLEL